MIKYSPTVTFLMILKKMDKARLTVRDALVIYIVMTDPGIDGLGVAKKLNFEHRSSVTSNVARLILEGLIEDRREKRGQAISSILHITDKGRAFWDDIKPKD